MAESFPTDLSASRRIVFVDGHRIAFLARKPDHDPATFEPSHLYVWDGTGTPQALTEAGSGVLALNPDGRLVIEYPRTDAPPVPALVDPDGGRVEIVDGAEAPALEALLREAAGAKYQLDAGDWQVAVEPDPEGHRITARRDGVVASLTMAWERTIIDNNNFLYRSAVSPEGALALLGVPQPYQRQTGAFTATGLPLAIVDPDGAVTRQAIPWQPAFGHGEIDLAFSAAGPVLAAGTGAAPGEDAVRAWVFLMTPGDLQPIGRHPILEGGIAVAPGGCRLGLVEAHDRRFGADRSPQRVGIVRLIDLCPPGDAP